MLKYLAIFHASTYQQDSGWHLYLHMYYREVVPQNQGKDKQPHAPSSLHMNRLSSLNTLGQFIDHSICSAIDLISPLPFEIVSFSTPAS